VHAEQKAKGANTGLSRRPPTNSGIAHARRRTARRNTIEIEHDVTSRIVASSKVNCATSSKTYPAEVNLFFQKEKRKGVNERHVRRDNGGGVRGGDVGQGVRVEVVGQYPEHVESEYDCERLPHGDALRSEYQQRLSARTKHRVFYSKEISSFFARTKCRVFYSKEIEFFCSNKISSFLLESNVEFLLESNVEFLLESNVEFFCSNELSSFIFAELLVTIRINKFSN